MAENHKGKRGTYGRGPMYDVTYDDGNGFVGTSRQGGKDLATFYGHGILDLLMKEGLVRLTVEIGRRKAVITPLKRR